MAVQAICHEPPTFDATGLSTVGTVARSVLNRNHHVMYLQCTMAHATTVFLEKLCLLISLITFNTQMKEKSKKVIICLPSHFMESVFLADYDYLTIFLRF